MADEDTSQLLAAASAHVDNSTPSGMAASWEHVESGVDHGNARPGQGDSETKTGTCWMMFVSWSTVCWVCALPFRSRTIMLSPGPAIPADLLAQVRAEAARGAREEMTRLLGDNAKCACPQNLPQSAAGRGTNRCVRFVMSRCLRPARSHSACEASVLCHHGMCCCAGHANVLPAASPTRVCRSCGRRRLN